MYLCHSSFSLRYGTLSVERLVEAAVVAGCTRLALTDVNAVSGVFDFVSACHKAGIAPVVGVDFRNGTEPAYVGLARNARGFAELNAFLSEHLLGGKPFPPRAPRFENAVVIYPLRALERGLQPADGEFVGVRWEDVTALWRWRSRLPPHRAVALLPVTFADKVTFNLHRLLRAVDANCLLSNLDPVRQAPPTERFHERQALLDRFGDHPHLLGNLDALLEECSFEFDFESPKNCRCYTQSEAGDLHLLRKLAEDGLRTRYGPRHAGARQRVESELRLIETLHFGAYFLITWDILRYARGRGFVHVGRGSGANSIVAYCVGITDVDPLELDLYFERFINPHRTSPPDFDLDFSWDERDEIIDYVFRRYGPEHVCLMAAYNTFQGASILRELGKVFGLPRRELDAWVDDERRVPEHPHAAYVQRYAPLMQELPNYLSIHAGGILVSELPLCHYTALQPMPKGFPICQWDMYVAEAIGFAKWDVLSQRGLGHIKEAVDRVRQNRGVAVDINAVERLKRDEKVAAQLAAHEAMGCFYVESPAMRQLLWKLGCRDYRTLVAASSVIRPGVASSGMMRQYIQRCLDPSCYTPVHPKLGELLAETHGVMVYQEDVLKVGHHFGGLTLPEADVLRRAMSGKFRSKAEFARLEDQFFANCRSFGYPDETAREVWRQIESFAGYSFSKAHSASYAVESYQSLYLKAHFPLEFLVAVVNNGGGFYAAEDYLREARRWGAYLEAPDVGRSEAATTLDGTVVWLGWQHVTGLERGVVERLLTERAKAPFASFEDFVRRVPAGLPQLLRLVRVGAFRSLGYTKKELLWRAHLLHNSVREMATGGSEALFDLPEAETALPALFHHALEDAYDELELLGFCLCPPFDLVRLPNGVTWTAARAMPDAVGRWVEMLGYYLTAKPVTTKGGGRMAFGYFVDEAGEYFDTVHFPPSLEKYPLRGRGVYRLKGKVVAEFGVPSLEVNELQKLPLKPDPRTQSPV